MTQIRDIPWRLPVLLAISLAATALFHGARGLFETTEGRYAECAREMAQTGSWLEPVLNGQPHWTKPPLTYLAIRAPYKLLGPTTWAARFFLIPCHLVAIAAVWWLAFRLWRDRQSAGMCAMVYATAVMPMVATQTVSADYLLTVLLGVAQACFWEAFRKRSRLAVHLLWASMGIAFLVKGPPALLVMPAMVMVWLRLPRPERRLVPLFAPTALALFFGVASSWYVWEAWRHPGLMNYWLTDEVVNRSLSDKYNRNPEFYKNLIIYLPVLLFGMLPWSGWLVFRWREAWARVRVPGGFRGMLTGFSDEALWLVWAVAFPLGVFMLSRSKLPLYVLPLFVPFAVGAGRLLMAVYRQNLWFHKAARMTAYAALIVFVIGKAGMAIYPSERDMLRLYRLLTEQCGVRDPARLAVLGEKPLNGLSFYYDYDLKSVPFDKTKEWADKGGERFLLCSGNQWEAAKQHLGSRAIKAQALSKHWHLIRIAKAAGAQVDVSVSRELTGVPGKE